ncbi:hypothetical protein RJ639_034245 [Escallonia herrerae]|uniref:DNA-directed RNA polymerase III subunit RPC5 n=1 Tax=Escallonia herrerae TaxID=1293975 RepID=A0AA89BEN7_9ASTE|nr:hypothetical protein RJ639_034245 [Escallonia herrerae]
MDLDDLDGPSQAAPSRTGRFAPKNSRPKPTPKPEPPSSSQPPPVPTPIKKEESDSRPPSVDSTGNEPSSVGAAATPAANGAVKMDVEAVPDGPEVDPMEEDDELYILQYPLKPCWRPYELDEQCEEVRVKPASAEFEIELSVDVDSNNYDHDADSRVRMTKQILSSSSKPPPATGYSVGVLLGNKGDRVGAPAERQKKDGTSGPSPMLKSKNRPARLGRLPIVGYGVLMRICSGSLRAGPLFFAGHRIWVLAGLISHGYPEGSGIPTWLALLHLNPIHAVVQLRPSMQHIKSVGSRRNNAEDVAMLEEPNEEKSVGPSKKQNKRPSAANEQNEDMEEAHGWVPLKYHGANSDISARYLQNMRNKKACDLATVLDEGSMGHETLWWGKPLRRFEALMDLAPDQPVEVVLEILKKLAHLIQGLWVPKSSLLYGKEENEFTDRDYILLLFSKNSVIRDAQLPKDPPKAMEDVLKLLAVKRPSFCHWKFKEPPDTSFIKLHPDIVKEQEQAWQHLEKPIIDFYFKGRKRSVGKIDSKPSLSEKAAASTNFNKAAIRTLNGASAGTLMSDESREALLKALQKLFQSHRVCRSEHICQRLREMAVSESNHRKGIAREAIAAVNVVNAHPEQLGEVITTVAREIYGVYVSKSSPDHPQYDQLRGIVIDLLIVRGPKAKLKKAEIIDVAKMQLKRDITPNEIQKAPFQALILCDRLLTAFLFIMLGVVSRLCALLAENYSQMAGDALGREEDNAGMNRAFAPRYEHISLKTKIGDLLFDGFSGNEVQG